MASYKINEERVKEYEMRYLIKKGLVELLNKSGDAAFRVWCRIITEEHLLLEEYPHMTKNSVKKGIETLLEEKWIEIDDNNTINIIVFGTIEDWKKWEEEYNEKVRKARKKYERI